MSLQHSALVFRRLICALLMLSSTPFVLAQGPTTAPVRSKLLEVKPTKDEKSGLQLNLPKGWVPKKEISETGFEAPYKDQVKTITLAPNVVMNEVDIAGVKPTDIDEIVKRQRQQILQQLPGTKEVSSPPPAKQIAGKGVGVMEFLMSPKPNALIHNRQTWIVGEGKVYVITWTSLDGTYAKNQKLFEASMDTLVVP